MSQDSTNLPEIPDLPEIPNLSEIPELPDEAALTPVDATTATASAQATNADGLAPLRVLEGAPKKLGTAAMIVAVGAFLPFMGANPGDWSGVGIERPFATWIGAFLVAKILIALGAYMWFAQVQHNWGPKLTGFLGGLANLAFTKKPKADEDKPKRKSARDQAPTTLKHPFPTALNILSLLFAIGGVIVLPMVWPAGDLGPLVAELGMFAWALYTWVHIRSYERWGSFNPIFPLMFLGMLASGLLRMVAGLAEGLKVNSGLASFLGGAIVLTGGAMAAYTMFLSLRQAKAEGDIKKKAALEARKAARSARR